MRWLFVLGVILLLLGFTLAFVPIPTRERHSIGAGGLSVGFETTKREKVHPAIAGGLIAGGAFLLAAGARRRRE